MGNGRRCKKIKTISCAREFSYEPYMDAPRLAKHSLGSGWQVEIAAPIRRPVSSEYANPWQRQPPFLDQPLPPLLQFQTALVSSKFGCDESRQPPIRIKRAAMTLPIALAASPRQKNVGAAACPMGSHIYVAADALAPSRCVDRRWRSDTTGPRLLQMI